eukprot:6610250-Pyramimonas_sp.AAC.1
MCQSWCRAIQAYVSDKQAEIHVEGKPSALAEHEADEGAFGLDKGGDGTPGGGAVRGIPGREEKAPFSAPTPSSL